MDSTAGAAIWDTQPMSDEEVLCRDEEIRWLIAHERQHWGLINGRLMSKGDPTAYGTYAGLAAIPPAATLANVTSLNGEASLWTTSLFTPWLANSLVAPSQWMLQASWTMAQPASAVTLTINPRVGSIAAGSSSTAGIALGADAQITMGSSAITTNWTASGLITVQSIGAPGANSKAYGTFNAQSPKTAAGTGPIALNDQFGFTQASFDASLAQGLVFGMANAVTTITYAVTQILWMSLF